MCGRYGYTNKKKEVIMKKFRLKQIEFDLVPRYNICPGQDVPVILNSDADKLTLARWGLIPSWAKDEKIGYKMINARSETIFEKPSFRNSIKKKRCLILADCFYEWKKDDTIKRPHCMRLKTKETFAFAGIWDCWHDELVTCSIITCQANSLLQSIHDRMPVILSDDEIDKWMKEANPDAIQEMLKPLDPEVMEAYEISTLVNSPSNTGCEIINPL